LKSKTGTITVGIEEILSRWEESIRDLFEGDRRERPEVYKEMEVPSILED